MNRLEIKKIAVKNLMRAFGQNGFPILLASFFLITSCYLPPSGTPISEPVKQPAVGEVKLPPIPAVKPPPAQVYFYPKYGQSPEQQDRDRYECYNWAKRQTGFDPNISLPPRQWVTVVPAAPPGRDAAVLGLAGAAVGALAAGPHNAPAGAAIGLVTGAAVGAASDAARQDQAKKIEEAYARQNQMLYTQFEKRGMDFRRAMSACLEGRGYSVQ